MAEDKLKLVGMEPTEFTDKLVRSVVEHLKKGPPDRLARLLIELASELPSNTPEYHELVASLLDRLTPGKMDARLCNALMRVTNLSSFEGVWLRESEKGLQVFLKQRPETDAHAREWHCPGTMMRASEKSEADVMERLGRCEFGGSPISWVATGDFYPVSDERGTLISHVFIVEPVEEEKAAEGGSWFDVKKLPENMVPHHRKIIADAVDFSEKF